MTDKPQLPEPAFRLKWRDGAYYVSKPNIGDTDCYTAEQMRAALSAGNNTQLDREPVAPDPRPSIGILSPSREQVNVLEDTLRDDPELALRAIREALLRAGKRRLEVLQERLAVEPNRVGVADHAGLRRLRPRQRDTDRAVPGISCISPTALAADRTSRVNVDSWAMSAIAFCVHSRSNAEPLGRDII